MQLLKRLCLLKNISEISVSFQKGERIRWQGRPRGRRSRWPSRPLPSATSGVFSTRGAACASGFPFHFLSQIASETVPLMALLSVLLNIRKSEPKCILRPALTPQTARIGARLSPWGRLPSAVPAWRGQLFFLPGGASRSRKKGLDD